MVVVVTWATAAPVSTTVRPEATGAERRSQYSDGQQQYNTLNHNNISLVGVSLIINVGRVRSTSAIR